MKGYIYIICICHHGYSYQSQAIPQVWELGWVGCDYGKRIDIFYLSFPFQARVVIGEGLVVHLEALGWLAMEGNDGINYVIWRAKTHEIPWYELRVGHWGWVSGISPDVTGREMRWGNGYIIRELVNHAWSGDADFLLWWDVRRISSNGFPNHHYCGLPD